MKIMIGDYVNEVPGAKAIEPGGFSGGASMTLEKIEQKQVKILLVDDDPEDRLFITEILEESFEKNFDFVVDSAVNYADALSLVKKNHYDLALFDYVIGYRNGIDLLERLKIDNHSLPVIFITGQGNEKVAVEAIKNGAVDYINKDELNSNNLKEVVSRNIKLDNKKLAKSIKQMFLKHQGKDILSLSFFKTVDALAQKDGSL